MAIHPDHPGIEVSVEVDGQRLPEYTTIDAEPTTFVQSQAGKEYIIVIRHSSECQALRIGDVRAVVEVDGNWLTNRILRETQWFRESEPGICRVAGEERSEGGFYTMRPLMFNRLQIGENEMRFKIIDTFR